MEVVDLSTFQVKSSKSSRFQDVELSRCAVQDVDMLDCPVVQMPRCRVVENEDFSSSHFPI